MNFKIILITALLFIWLVPIAVVAWSVEFQPGACRMPFYGWLAIWPVFSILPESWQDAYVMWTFSLCR